MGTTDLNQVSEIILDSIEAGSQQSLPLVDKHTSLLQGIERLDIGRLEVLVTAIVWSAANDVVA